MYIIGMIFKIIGLLLLLLLGIMLVLLVSVLFVPIHYKIRWEKQPETSHCVHAMLSWWLHSLALSVEYQEQFHYVIRVFGISIKKGSFQQEETDHEEEPWENDSDDFERDSSLGEREDFQNDRNTETVDGEKRLSVTLEKWREKKETSGCVEDEEQPDGKDNISKDVQKEIFSTKQNKTSQKENTKKESIDIETDAQEFEIALQNPPKRKSYVWKRWVKKVKQFVAFLKKIPRFIKSKFYKVRNLWQNVDGRREHMLRQIHIALDFWRAEENQGGKKLFFYRGKKIVKHIFPKKCKGYIRFGLSDPAATGQALAVISIISGLVGLIPNIEPDFSKGTLEGNFYCRGRLQIGYLLWQGLRLWFHKDMKKVKDNFEKVRRAF